VHQFSWLSNYKKKTLGSFGWSYRGHMPWVRAAPTPFKLGEKQYGHFKNWTVPCPREMQSSSIVSLLNFSCIFMLGDLVRWTTTSFIFINIPHPVLQLVIQVLENLAFILHKDYQHWVAWSISITISSSCT